MDDYFPKRHKRRIVELNIVPILDMLTTVIFFLLLSTSFMEYTKLTVPPSGASVITDPLVPPPLGPRLILFRSSGKELRAMLTWSGAKPGEAQETVSISDLDGTRLSLLTATRKLSKEFLVKFPKEKTLQIGLDAKLPYQYLIAGMDGVRDSLPDIVLISPAEVAARSRQFKGSEAK